jgi:hypothetical protein
MKPVYGESRKKYWTQKSLNSQMVSLLFGRITIRDGLVPIEDRLKSRGGFTNETQYN